MSLGDKLDKKRRRTAGMITVVLVPVSEDPRALTVDLPMADSTLSCLSMLYHFPDDYGDFSDLATVIKAPSKW